jgi:hypothetical protein
MPCRVESCRQGSAQVAPAGDEKRLLLWRAG